ncbi:hypothetical protein L2747_18780 [Shewanella marinintestina]|uniref:hypothetical protein n=1 Tax=Shewanella marinintestina TaxID=190305 RepID=UPI00200D4388|nr:hypothetical protein [Shewanella marinintestina]MCL1148052.1 hypothetical protein [Shewanella marinintestina]
MSVTLIVLIYALGKYTSKGFKSRVIIAVFLHFVFIAMRLGKVYSDPALIVNYEVIVIWLAQVIITGLLLIIGSLFLSGVNALFIRYRNKGAQKMNNPITKFIGWYKAKNSKQRGIVFASGVVLSLIPIVGWIGLSWWVMPILVCGEFQAQESAKEK